MVAKLMFVVVVMLVSLGRISYTQVITEVLFNYPYEKSICQYVEIFNNLSQPLDMRHFCLLVQGYEIRITNIFLSDFETEGVTNSFLLNPGQFAVVLPYSYSYSSKPFYFPSNTLILTSSTKYLGGATPLSEDILSTIRLVSNNVVVDYVSYIPRGSEGVSVERGGSGFVLTGKPSFGSLGNVRSIWFSKYLYTTSESIEVFVRLSTNVYYLSAEVLTRGYVTLNKVSEDTFKGIITPLYNGERVVVRFEGMVSATRSLNLFEVSAERKLVLNEVCFLPTKQWFDYFQGGSGVGRPREVDKYLEIVNLSCDDIPVSNLYIHYVSPNKELIFRVRDNAYYSSRRGAITGLDCIRQGEYILVSVPEVSSNGAYLLRDGYPYKGGKLIHFVESEGVGIIPFAHSNTFRFSGKPTVSLLPNALPAELGGRFLNWGETPARYNGFREPSIIVDSRYKKVGTVVSIYLVDEVVESMVLVRVYTRNTRVTRSIALTNAGLWFYGEFLVSTDPSATIFVMENDEVTLEYRRGDEVFFESFFVIPEGAKEIAGSGFVLIEKGVIKLGEPIKFVGVRKGDRVKIFTKEGDFVKEATIESYGIYEVNSSFLVKRGVFFVEYDREGTKAFFKLIVY